MIPLRDDIPSSSQPWVTRILIAANVVAFLWELTAGEQLSDFLLVPAHAAQNPATILTSMFLHGGWMHLIGNMLYLHIFGDNIEDRLGHARYAVFYLVCGIAAAVAQIVAAPGSMVPMLGASGAIAGVLGGYLVLFPRARVLTFVPWFLGTVAVPALLYLGFWFLLQLVSGMMTLGQGQGGVAFFAHAGGFVAGLLLVKVLDKGPHGSTWDVHPRDRYV